ncbi:breast cancer type 2 susceptibility protein homolog isoform X1 [Drosophila subobscura]|uniref:breast cancer type 2 susceptibility protein homolog isoform X1 n=1 Tax=Drosophila subobscura TaxID=7241 RepID=UPI00155A9585|nr:breast cancer type 2 susceptibility protein homolog isoform X1 [Drosophila subobscura]
MDRERIVASPSASDSNSSVHSQRLRRRDKRRRDNDNASTDHISIVAEVANIYKADLQDSLLALQMPQKNRFLEQSNDFISVHDLLLSQDDYSIPQEQEEAAPVPISELILRDFCSSPTYEEEEDEPIYDSPPWFRFRKKRIKTYSRKPPTRKEPPVATHEDEEDRMSCSSGLSVQEDHTAAAHVPPTTALSELDANSSQKICENLLNLSEYFSLSNPSPKPSKATAGIHKAIAANTSIDLPIKQEATLQRKNVDSDSSVECTTVECASRELGDEPSDVCDNKRPQGNETNTLFGKSGRIRRTCLDSKVCEDWSEGDSFLVTYNTEKMPLDDDEPEQTDNSDEQPTKGSETNDPSTQFTLEDIPISEWQTTMDVPDVSNCKTEAPPDQTVKLEETVKIEAEFLHCISDWEPLDIPEGIAFRTASNKPIEVSEEMQMKAAKLLADVEAGEWKPMDTGESVGFRTASNKTIEVSEENELKAARLLADVQAADQMSKIEISDTQFLQDIHLSQWPAMDVPEAVEFRTASNKCIQISEEMRLKAAKLIAEVEAGEVSKPETTSNHQNPKEIVVSECQEMAGSEVFGFRTASNKRIEVSEEMKAKAAKLVADVEATNINEWNPMDNPETVAIQPATNKYIQVSEEMRLKAAKLIAEVEAEYVSQPKPSRSQTHKENNLNAWQDMDTSEVFGFRTASNKPIEISEEMKARAAQLLAEVEAADFNEFNPIDKSETFGFRTASNKHIPVSEEMRMKAAKLIAEVEAGDVSKPKPSSSGNLQEMCINECQEMDASEFVGFRTASNKPIQVSEEMQAKAAKLLADLQAPSDAQFLQEMDLAEWEAMDISEVSVNERQPSDIPQKVGFKTASNKQIEVSEEMKAKAAKLIADVYAEPINEPIQKSHQAAPSSGAQEVVDEASVGAAVPLNCDPECQLELSDYHSGDDFKGFQLDDCQPIDLLDLNVFPRQSQKAEHKADSKSVTPKQRRETCEGIPSSKRRRRHADTQKLSTTPQKHGRQLSKTTSCHSALESPIKSQSVPDSLSQLGARSPLDRITKTSVIARRNLLSLSRRRKRVSTVGDECPAQPTDTVTPVKPRFGPMSASTSTPLANRNINIVEEDVSPICMPPQKAPRIGLSRSRY